MASVGTIRGHWGAETGSLDEAVFTTGSPDIVDMASTNGTDPNVGIWRLGPFAMNHSVNCYFVNTSEIVRFQGESNSDPYFSAICNFMQTNSVSATFSMRTLDSAGFGTIAVEGYGSGGSGTWGLQVTDVGGTSTTTQSGAIADYVNDQWCTIQVIYQVSTNANVYVLFNGKLVITATGYNTFPQSAYGSRVQIEPVGYYDDIVALSGNPTTWDEMVPGGLNANPWHPKVVGYMTRFDGIVDTKVVTYDGGSATTVGNWSNCAVIPFNTGGTTAFEDGGACGAHIRCIGGSNPYTHVYFTLAENLIDTVTWTSEWSLVSGIWCANDGVHWCVAGQGFGGVTCRVRMYQNSTPFDYSTRALIGTFTPGQSGVEPNAGFASDNGTVFWYYDQATNDIRMWNLSAPFDFTGISFGSPDVRYNAASSGDWGGCAIAYDVANDEMRFMLNTTGYDFTYSTSVPAGFYTNNVAVPTISDSTFSSANIIPYTRNSYSWSKNGYTRSGWSNNGAASSYFSTWYGIYSGGGDPYSNATGDTYTGASDQQYANTSGDYTTSTVFGDKDQYIAFGNESTMTFSHLLRPCSSVRYIPGPPTDARINFNKEEVASVKVMGSIDRGSGSGTSHFIRVGNETTQTDIAISLTTSFQYYEGYENTNLPSSTSYLCVGFGKSSGGREIYAAGLMGQVLYLPIVTESLPAIDMPKRANWSNGRLGR